ARPTVSNLVPGTYSFRITATAAGKSDYDEVTLKLGDPNIALNKPVVASSTESASTPASAANDGSLSSRWSSAFSDPQWIRIDLQSVYNLTGARIFWEAAAAKTFDIQISVNGTSWTTVYSTSSGDGGMDSFVFAATARYIRMYSSARITQYGNSIYEFEVFGTLQTGIEEIDAGETFSAYPNPVTGEIIKVSFSNSWAEEDVLFSITGMSGQTLFSGQVHIPHERVVEIRLPSILQTSPGIYILSVRGSVMTDQKKLIVSR
ncbi:MAG: discoidin domain-containing protein, partial [Bacteroidales bacterium]|nr:discoidin domain-containing protein [Bacteroidales bacterium]